jgi:GH24 family phage-related lysozyme (muramidase)
MRTNQAGIELIKKFEGLRLTPYRCPAGILTAGWGSIRAGKLGRAITLDEAENFLRSDIEEVEGALNKFVNVEVNDNEWSALVSFAYNLGPKALRFSRLIEILNRGDRSAAARQFGRWIYIDGKPSFGLAGRRKAERELFEKVAS